MSESADIHNALLASHPDDPAWKLASGETEWWRPDPPRPPCELWTTAAAYSGTGSDRGQSPREQVYGLVPSRRLYDLLGLTRADDFAWADQQGLIVVEDPSVKEDRPSSLLACRDEASSRLLSEGLTIFWTVLGGKDLTGDCQWPVGSARWRTVELPGGGQQNCPLAARCSARRSVGQWRHPLSGGGLGEADAVAGGHDDVGVVQQPVDGGVGDGLGHEFVEAGRVKIAR